jgi:hypothetical protein
MKLPHRPTIVSLTTIPPRFPHLPRKLASLLKQSVPASAIELYIPKAYRRFPGEVPKLPPLPEGVTVVTVDRDFGPGTKLLPALEKWHGQDVDILICDDDRLQDRDWIKRLTYSRGSRPNDIICERGWSISDRFGIVQSQILMPRAIQSKRQGRTLSYRLKRMLSFGLHHPKRSLYEMGGYVDVFEGFLGALIPSGAMPAIAWSIPDVLWTVDDVWLSGMAKLNGVGVWAHSIPRPIHSNGFWDKVAALTNFVEQGKDREKADRMCVEYMRQNHGVWL